MTLIAQLSDLHIREPGRLAFGGLDTSTYLRAAVDRVQKLPQKPDAIVITGDLVDYGKPAEYAHLAELLVGLEPPVYLLPGNHDDPAAMREAFPRHRYLGAAWDACYSVPIGELQLVALDTTVPFASHGELREDRLAWLASALEQAGERPVLLAMHHPPFRTLIRAMDDMGLLRGAAEFEAIVRRHSNVERVICGHLHRAIDARFGGTIASTCPSPAHQIALDLDPEAKLQWTLEPGAIKLHAWDAGRGLVTHQVAVGEFAGPNPFTG